MSTACSPARWPHRLARQRRSRDPARWSRSRSRSSPWRLASCRCGLSAWCRSVGRIAAVAHCHDAGRRISEAGEGTVTGAMALLVATVVVPLAMLAACLSGAARRRMPDLLALAPLPGLAAALLVGDAPPLVMDEARLRFTLGLDGPSALLLGVAALLWSAAGAYAAAYPGTKQRAESFAVWWLLTLSGSLGVFIAGDLGTFYFAFAVVSLSAYGLVVHDRTDQARHAGAV